jgi:CRISPR-associated endonuclease Cas3-HD
LTYYGHSSESADKTTWQPLRDHLTAVAGRSRDFAAAFGAGQTAWIAGLCHDLGKYSSEFQRRLEDSRVRVDHSSAGAALAFNKYGSIGRLIAYAVAGHHGGMPDGGDADESSLIWRVTRKDIPNFSAYTDEIQLPDEAPRLEVRPQPCWPGFTASFFVRMLFSCLVDADCLDTEGFS